MRYGDVCPRFAFAVSLIIASLALATAAGAQFARGPATFDKFVYSNAHSFASSETTAAGPIEQFPWFVLGRPPPVLPE